MIFVFGSNRRGLHGAGAALYAYRNCGAVIGIGEGPQGYSYAIPTKNEHLYTIPLPELRAGVDRFIEYATAHPELQFKVTAIGTGLAGYTHSDIAPMFAGAPWNCAFDERWHHWLPDTARFWGDGDSPA